jgi:hypothetical protein
MIDGKAVESKNFFMLEPEKGESSGVGVHFDFGDAKVTGIWWKASGSRSRRRIEHHPKHGTVGVVVMVSRSSGNGLPILENSRP